MVAWIVLGVSALVILGLIGVLFIDNWEIAIIALAVATLFFSACIGLVWSLYTLLY